MKKIIIILFGLIILQTQAQVSPCDSLTYWTDQGQGLFVGVDTALIPFSPDSIDVYWQACNTTTCYSGVGMDFFFGQILTSDTIKLCYDAYLYTTNTLEVCTHCDSLIYDGFSWILFSMSNPVSINELTFNKITYNKMYDLLGREVNELQTGVILIRNRKKYITIK